ncbi:MAG: hypothetical protein U1E34_04550 [Amaricoccus sp.]
MSLIDDFVAQLRPGLAGLAQTLFSDTVAAAESDGESLVADSRAKLERWLDLLAQKQITREEFEFLLGMQADLARMHALKAAGITRQRIERFRQSVISLLISTAFSLVPIK